MHEKQRKSLQEFLCHNLQTTVSQAFFGHKRKYSMMVMRLNANMLMWPQTLSTHALSLITSDNQNDEDNE